MTFLTILKAAWGVLTSKAGMITIAALLALYGVYWALDRAGDVREAKVHRDYQEGSTEAVLDAVNGEREANANSDVRRDAEGEKKAAIQKGIDDAKANGDSPIVGYFDGLRKAQSGDAKDSPAK